MRRWNLFIDVGKCEDCNDCFLACKDEHVGNDWPGYSAAQPLHGQRWMNIMRKERGAYPMVDVAYRPTPCQHCDDAPCVRATQGGAVYKREDGIVVIDPVKAKGQRELVKACSYGAIYWNDELDLPQKCTMCAHLLDEGWDKPRCVQSCPTGALTFTQATDADVQAKVEREGWEVLMSENGTSPRVYYKNLYRFDSLFIGGTVSYDAEGRTECAEGAKVTLVRDGEPMASHLTDAFGDFKFDGLRAESGAHAVVVSHDGRERTVEAQLAKESIYLGDMAV